MPSKAQGLSLNTIIIAAIVLIVLLILVGMTTGYFGKWGPKFRLASATSCSEISGVPIKDRCYYPEQEAKGFFEDVKEGEKCCYKVCSAAGGSCVPSCPSSQKLTRVDWDCKKWFPAKPDCCKT